MRTTFLTILLVLLLFTGVHGQQSSQSPYAIDASGTVLQVVENGILSTDTSGDYGPEQQRTSTEIVHERTYHGALSGWSNDARKVYHTNTFRRSARFKEVVFIEMPTAGLVDDSRWEAKIYCIGTHTYSTTGGAQKTIKKFTSSEAEAVAAESEARRLAMQRYPGLAVEGSAFNAAFVERYKHYQKEDPDYFLDRTWTLSLAEEVARSVQP